jgi:hypothetical protein
MKRYGGDSIPCADAPPGVSLLWTRKEMALRGTRPDEVLPERPGRTTMAVRVKPARKDLRTARDRQREAKARLTDDRLLARWEATPTAPRSFFLLPEPNQYW